MAATRIYIVVTLSELRLKRLNNTKPHLTMGLFLCLLISKGLHMGHIIKEQRAKALAWSTMMRGGIIATLPNGDGKNLPKSNG